MRLCRIVFFAFACVMQTLVLQGLATVSFASSYDIREGDVLSISVYRQDELNLDVRVSESGTVSYPLVGSMQVVNKSLGEIEKRIAKVLYRNGFESPQVVVSVKSFAPRSVFVLGEVNSPDEASINIPVGGEITAMQAVSLMGGVKASGDISKIVVRRKLANGEGTLIPVPAVDILMGKNVADVLLQAGDTVVVPKALPVSVLGTANRPGQFYITPDVPMTVSMAISLAGGVERPNSLSVLRVTRGSTSFEVDIQDFLEDGKGSGKGDVLLQPGDVLYVPETRW